MNMNVDLVCAVYVLGVYVLGFVSLLFKNSLDGLPGLLGCIFFVWIFAGLATIIKLLFWNKKND